MILSINSAPIRNQKMGMMQQNVVPKSSQVNETKFTGYSLAASNALKANAINMNLARTISFGSIMQLWTDASKLMKTCVVYDDNGKVIKDGEDVSTNISVNEMAIGAREQLQNPGSAAEGLMKTGKSDTRLKFSMPKEHGIKFALTKLKEGKSAFDRPKKPEDVAQHIEIHVDPMNHLGVGTKEQAYILDTRGNYLAVVEDGKNVLLTNTGEISKINNPIGNRLSVKTTKADNVFKAFEPIKAGIVETERKDSIGTGTEVIIGMENARYVDEIKASIVDFKEKIDGGEIILPQFVAAPNAQDMQLIMLAGGFGSRAEYTNASSEAIMHGEPKGAQSTKGVFRTATGLTPMETTFITLHKNGLLDCNNIEIGNNVKFYENKGQNRGNGEFSADLYATMPRDNRKAALILSNDAMSRMVQATKEATELATSGKAAIAMIAKKVKSQDCVNTFGVIHYNKDTKQILGFEEKPSAEKLEEIKKDYVDENGMCVTNTFHFAVSDEAFEVLDKFEELFKPVWDSKKQKWKETRDWSNNFTPVIKILTEDHDLETTKQLLSKPLNNAAENIPDELVLEAKALLGDQKMYVVPTEEAWADCGTLDQLYDTTMKIASGQFKGLENFEIQHVLDSINTKTGLVASSPEQKAEIEAKYNINGQVMVVPKAECIPASKIADIDVTIHKD